MNKLTKLDKEVLCLLHKKRRSTLEVVGALDSNEYSVKMIHISLQKLKRIKKIKLVTIAYKSCWRLDR